MDQTKCHLENWEVTNRRLNFLMEGIIHADVVTTVSPTYAKEIAKGVHGKRVVEVFKRRKDHMIGILNGLDTRVWDPKTDLSLPIQYEEDSVSSAKRVIKEQLQKNSEIPVHIKPFDLYSFFDESNFAKESIIIYGKSIISNDYFAKNLGFTPKIQISYSLKNLRKKDKIKFHYMLKGKKGNYGLLKKYGGSLINPGLIEIFPEYENIFIESIKKLTPNFKIKKILF